MRDVFVLYQMCLCVCVTSHFLLSWSLTVDCKELGSDRMERGDGGVRQRDGGMESQAAE